MEDCGSFHAAGVGVVDPRRLPFNNLPPPVHIEQVVADRKTYDCECRRRWPTSACPR